MHELHNVHTPNQNLTLFCCSGSEIILWLDVRKIKYIYIYSKKRDVLKLEVFFIYILCCIFSFCRHGAYFVHVHSRAHMSVRVRALSLPAFPSTPWLREKVSVKALCRICTLPTSIIPTAESLTRSQNKIACSAAKRTTLCAISCCPSSFCSSTLALYHPFSPKALDR